MATVLYNDPYMEDFLQSQSPAGVAMRQAMPMNPTETSVPTQARQPSLRGAMMQAIPFYNKYSHVPGTSGQTTSNTYSQQAGIITSLLGRLLGR